MLGHTIRLGAIGWPAARRATVQDQSFVPCTCTLSLRSKQCANSRAPGPRRFASGTRPPPATSGSRARGPLARTHSEITILSANLAVRRDNVTFYDRTFTENQNSTLTLFVLIGNTGADCEPRRRRWYLAGSQAPGSFERTPG
ncbi:hypothetical protein EVAR_50502_1 [Eumeta japonica]|uniref:Uncharacterized protein n=1 Tax=Eumeta variegata TaxID=151549 RepID=A0A4C1X9A9_EUMVA|nr:hypothetical protein EVAR_50502_1 [Eumeta japonica]